MDDSADVAAAALREILTSNPSGIGGGLAVRPSLSGAREAILAEGYATRGHSTYVPCDERVERA